jgi:hypothetical protein
MDSPAETDFSSWDALNAFVSRKVPESSTVEYKRDPYANPRQPPARQREEKDELRRDVTSMANAGGGWLIIGVPEHTTGEPLALVGFPSLRDHENRTRETLSRRISPPLSTGTSVGALFRPGSESEGAIVIRVEAADLHKPFAVLREDEVVEFWVRKDKSKRPMSYGEIASAFTPTADELQGHSIAANARFHIEHIRKAIVSSHREWRRVAELCRELRQYCEHPSLEVRRDVVRAVYEAIDYPRAGLPRELAFDAADILRDALPIHSLVHPHHRAIEKPETAILEEAVEYVWPLVFDGISRLRDLSVMWAGAEVLSDLLRFAVLNRLTELARRVDEQLGAGARVARELGDADAERLLKYAVGDARDRNEPLPTGLEWVVHRHAPPTRLLDYN